MDRIVALAAALAVLASCARRDAGPREESAAGEAGERILEDARAEIRGQVYPLYGDVSVNELTEKVDEAAKRAFGPRMAQLVPLGSRAYLTLPRADIDTAEYGPLLRQRPEADPEAFAALASEQRATGRILSVSWSPVMLASLLRTAVISREEGAEGMAKLSTLNGVAPPRALRLGDDPQNPVVVFEEPSACLTVVTLALQGDRFVPVGAQRLKKK